MTDSESNQGKKKANIKLGDKMGKEQRKSC